VFLRQDGSLVLERNNMDAAVTGPGAVLDEVWSHVVITHDLSASPSTIFYVNGDMLDASDGILGPFSDAMANGLWIGRRSWNAEPLRFPGTLDEVAIYVDETLSPERVSTHYRAGCDQSSRYARVVMNDKPDAYYRLGDADSVAQDISSYEHHGEYLGGVAQQISGAIVADEDRAARFEANNHRVETGQQGGALGFTLEAWIRPSTGASGSVQSVLSKNEVEPSTPSNFPSVLRFNPSTGKASLVLSRGNDLTPDLTLASDELSPGWHHLVATYKPDVRARLFVDGVSVESSTIDWSISANGLEWSIGRAAAKSSSGTWQAFDGRIDEVAIYDSALSADRVLTHYEAGKNLALTNPKTFLRWDLAADPEGAHDTEIEMRFDGSVVGTARVLTPYGWRNQSIPVTVDPASFGAHTVEWRHLAGFDSAHVRNVRIESDLPGLTWYDQYGPTFWNNEVASDNDGPGQQLDVQGSSRPSGAFVEHYFPGNGYIARQDLVLPDFFDAVESTCSSGEVVSLTIAKECTYQLMHQYSTVGTVTATYCETANGVRLCTNVLMAVPQNPPTIDDDEPPHQPEGQGWSWQGTGSPGTSQGNWTRPCAGGGLERVHLDYDHSPPKPPHISWEDCSETVWERLWQHVDKVWRNASLDPDWWKALV
jgi:hypothetical protein